MTLTIDVPRVVLIVTALILIVGFAIAWVLALLGSTDDPDPGDDDQRPAEAVRRARLELHSKLKR